MLHLQISDDEHHGAWGSQKNLFYDGNYLSEDSGSDGANNLEQEEIDLTEKKLSGILREADYEPYWPEINKLAVSRLPFFYLHFLICAILRSLRMWVLYQLVSVAFLDGKGLTVMQTDKIPAVQKIISSLQGCNKLLQEYIWYSGIQESLLTPDVCIL